MIEGRAVPYLRVANVFDGYIDFSDINQMPFKQREIETFRLRPGDILLNEGQSVELVGRCAMYADGPEDCCFQNTLIRYRAGPETDANFAIQLFRYCQAIGIFSRIAVKTNSIAHLGVSRFAELELPFPPLPEQRKIAEILRTWDEVIEKLEALRAAKERRLDGVSQRLLAPSRAVGHGVPRSNWAATSFGEVFDERQDKNANLGPDDVITVGKYAIRKQSEHFTRSVASKDLSNYWTISPGDFVYDPMSAYYGAIGRFSGSTDGIVSPAYRVIRLHPDVDHKFMVALLRTHHIRFLLETRSSQGNKEGKRRLLQRDEFESIEFKLPPIQTQREIAAQIAVFRAELDLTDREIQALTRQKRGLMQKLLTGEWRVAV
ncbi:MAG: restriction endonuclease subunit S [Hyphomicrobium sp.]|uniref:restriction endonuclease subunit S n=1 Tax=Hyphomicrobium sp. TaxID=82 RepID=UPI0025B8451E|nr:restriction endonuclease subunit S [Hyphomicrobium sp.]MBX9864868.1 restriction endonuclease subunit S [Hyphomicrobium sp.]